MAEIILETIEKEQIRSLARLLDDDLSLFSYSDGNEHIHLRVAPVKISTTVSYNEVSSEIWETNWERVINYSSAYLDTDWAALMNECAVIRKKAKMAVKFTPFREERCNNTAIEGVKLESRNTYLAEGHIMREAHMKTLPEKLKEELLDEATVMLLDYLEKWVGNPEKIAESTELIRNALDAV
jgi:hypothetical protein